VLALLGQACGTCEGIVPLDCAEVRSNEFDTRLLQGRQRLLSSRLKRVIDFVGALSGVILLAPFLLLVALLIRIESRGPALFRQRRTGYDGVPFVIYKFRTMKVVEDGASIKQCTRHDCRATRLGRILRRTCIDELPQLLNVLKGEMSLVGPRPHAVAHDRYYSATLSAYDARFMVKPGITGLAQVNGLRGETPNIESMAARVDQDLEYIRQWTPALDAQIMMRTLWVVPFDGMSY
jgi:lipopolysaccharide/colanic/teichoic acid biosynthesis glycosyltransferase